MLVDVGEDRPRYFLFINGRWRWRPTDAMRAKGFKLVTLGAGGPERDARGDPKASIEDKQRALALNAEWDRMRLGLPALPASSSETVPEYPPGSVGEAYRRAIKLREAERKQKGIIWTRDHEKRDDWPRAWRWLGPEFGDCDPKTIVPEHFIDVDPITGAVCGLYQKIEAVVSVGERHRTIKVWRALFVRMKALKYLPEDAADPSLAFANPAPPPASGIWRFDEVRRLVKRALRMGMPGMAVAIAIGWDTQLSPVDIRKLTLAQRHQDRRGTWFDLARTKTAVGAIATLTRRSERLLDWYLARSSAEPLPTAPFVRNRSGDAYTQDTFGDDFRDVRAAEFGPAETRKFGSDIRRSGSVEAVAGKADPAGMSKKMGNTVGTSNRLHRTYVPGQVAIVRDVDAARELGRAKLRERK